jgi:hypothetical protein
MARAVGSLLFGFYMAMVLYDLPLLMRASSVAIYALLALLSLNSATLRLRVTRSALSQRLPFDWSELRVARADVVTVDLARRSPLTVWRHRWFGPLHVFRLDVVRVTPRQGSVLFFGYDDPVRLKETLESE